MHRLLLLRKGGGVRVGDHRGVVASPEVDHRLRKSLENAFIVARRVTLRKIALP